MQSQYHEGEREAQRLAGESATAEARDGMMQSRIAAAAHRWLQAQTLIAVATLDPQERLWASALTGIPGFLQSPPDGAALHINHAISADILAALDVHPHIGLLAIDLSTRQRMRVNGTATPTAAGLRVDVSESFFNCPKYITRRFASPSSLPGSSPLGEGTQLRAEDLRLLHETDVAFLATMHPQRGHDASHRGGDPGFIQLLPDGRIRIPDYTGNSLFNSLGNLLVDSRIGLTVPDLRTGRVLQITGTATIDWKAPDPADATGGTHRFVDVTPAAWKVTDGGPTSGASSELSPFNPHPVAT